MPPTPKNARSLSINEINVAGGLFLASTLVASLEAELSNLSSIDPIHLCGSSVVSLLSTRPIDVIDLAHQKLHAFPFRDVPLYWRRAYEEASLWKIVKLLKCYQNETFDGQPSRHVCETDQAEEPDWVNDVVAACDMVMILTGAPERRAIIEQILATLENPEAKARDRLGRPSKRSRLSNAPNESTRPKFASITQGCKPRVNTSITRISCPSLAWFKNHMHVEEAPVILTDTIRHWPALHRWRDPSYWLRRTHSGKRLVPVELGRSYTDDAWAQKIIPFGEYMSEHLMADDGDNLHDVRPKGYLAQHDLLGQIPALRNDILIPDYCYVEPPRPKLEGGIVPAAFLTLESDSNAQDMEEEEEDATEPLLNIWFGPEHTISPAHTDPHHNILAQVVGRKFVRLFAPNETEKMYPITQGNIDMGNTSSVDVGVFIDLDPPAEAMADQTESKRGEQMNRYPLFGAAKYVEVILEPGDCLYIPRGWWHYVRSLEVSCSVSFWWD